MSDDPRSTVLVKNIRRRNPFRVTKVPPLAQVYAWPMNRWRESRGRQILFGAPSLALFLLWRALPPFGTRGTGSLKTQQGEEAFDYDARNSQFQALYLDEFQAGYEPEVAAVLDILLPDTGVFFDIGSNFGYFSALAATRPGFRGKIHAFEPFSSSYRDLSRLIQQAKLSALIEAHQLALSDREGAAHMSLPDRIHSGLATMQPAAAATPGTVRMMPLDQLTLPAPSVMKVDAEGAELSILKGASRTLAGSCPHILFESLRQFSCLEQTLAPFELLARHGYEFFQPVWLRTAGEAQAFLPSDGNHGARDEETLALVPLRTADRFLRQDQINVLAVHRSRLAELRQAFDNSGLTTT